MGFAHPWPNGGPCSAVGAISLIGPSASHTKVYWKAVFRTVLTLTDARLNKGDPILSDYGTHHAAAVKFHVEKFRRNEQSNDQERNCKQLRGGASPQAARPAMQNSFWRDSRFSAKSRMIRRREEKADEPG